MHLLNIKMKIVQIIGLYLVSIASNTFILGTIWFYNSGWYFGAKEFVSEMFWYSGALSIILIILNLFKIQKSYRILSALLIAQSWIISFGRQIENFIN